jgi:erythronate-4-phosphate dehydrogenase
MIKIVADNKIPFLKGVLEPYAQVRYYPGKEITPDKVRDADALIVRTRTRCDANLLEGSNVRFIATATIGFDHIDTEYCRRNNIQWTNAPGCNSGSVMQYIASALVFLSEKYGFDYKNITLGVVGVGNVGSKVVNIADALGMKVLMNDPPRERKEGKNAFVPLETILRQADIITFHVPLDRDGTDKTYHLADDAFFDKLHHDAIIINSSRGEVVDNKALKNALKTRKVKAAVLDVWENEPGLDPELLDLVDIGTPHIAGYSVDGKAMGTAMSVQAVSRFFGFDLDRWFPSGLPAPANTIIKLEGENLSSREIINQAIRATYNIEEDDKRLRSSPESFEQQRGDYPVRREFGAFQLILKNVPQKTQQTLKKIGFNI